MRAVGPGISGSHGLNPSPQLRDNSLTESSTRARRVVPVDRSRVDPRIVEAGEGMEAMFLEYMMKVMRQTVPKSEMDLENAGSEVYRGLLDGEIAKTAARSQGLGLADQVIAYLDSQRYTLRESTGGTYEREPGQSDYQQRDSGNQASRNQASGKQGR